MAFAVLITWFAAVLAGLYMLAVWLIENDVTGSGVAASRLPVTVVFGHLALAVCGLGLWVTYLVLDQKRFAWAAIGVLAGIALLGFTMFARWIPVYREPDAPATPGLPAGAGAGTAGPAEGNFPVAVVTAHGLFAVATLVLAILSALSSSAVLCTHRPGQPAARWRTGHQTLNRCNLPHWQLPRISCSRAANARGRRMNPEWFPGNSASGLPSSSASAWAQ
jgi:hypothetical protein